MYGKGAVLGATTIATGTVAAVVLPNTGGNLFIGVAISVVAGLTTWGVLYVRSTR